MKIYVATIIITFYYIPALLLPVHSMCTGNDNSNDNRTNCCRGSGLDTRLIVYAYAGFQGGVGRGGICVLALYYGRDTMYTRLWVSFGVAR